MIVNKLRITPTPSNTPSNTPTITPSLSSCPVLYYFQPYVEVCNEYIPQVLDLTGYTLTYSGMEFNQITNFTNPSDSTYCAVGPTIYGTTGTTYRFDFRIDNPNWELCEGTSSGITYDRIDVILTEYLGETSPGEKEWNCTMYYYLNNVLQSVSGPINMIFFSYLTTDNPNCPLINLVFNQSLRFSVREVVTPSSTPTNTPSSTPTITPSPTSDCYGELFIDNDFCGALPGGYNRFTNYSGGSFTYAWMGNSDVFNTGTAPDTLNYTAWIKQSGSTYYQILNKSDEWILYVTTGNTIANGGYLDYSSLLLATGNSITYNSGQYPKPGNFICAGSNINNISYSLICVTSTPTMTPSNTPTLTKTPTNTPSMTQTQTNTSTPTRSPEITPSMTQTQTQTNTPSVTPQCQQINLYPDNNNPCDHLNTLTQYDTDSALSPTKLYVNGQCGSTPVVGNNKWFSQGPGSDSYQVDNSGNVISVFNCP